MKRDCAAIGGKLTAFFDGEIEGAEADEVALHLETCAACRERFAAYDRIDAPLREIAAPRVESGEWSRVWGVIEAAIATEAAPAAAPASESKVIARIGTATSDTVLFVRFLTRMAAAALVAVTLVGWRVVAADASVPAAAAVDAGVLDFGPGFGPSIGD